MCQVTLTVGTPPFHLKSPRVTISLLKLNVITQLIIDEDDSDWDGRGRFFPGSWGGDRHASTPTGDGTPKSPLGVFTRSGGSTHTAPAGAGAGARAVHGKQPSPFPSSPSHSHSQSNSSRRNSEDHGERRKEDLTSRDPKKVKKIKKEKKKEKGNDKVKGKEKDKDKEKEQIGGKHRAKDKLRERERSLSRDWDRGVEGEGEGEEESAQSVPQRPQQSIYIAVQQVHPIFNCYELRF